MIKTILGLVLFLVPAMAQIQQNELLDSYIKEGLKNNLALRQKHFDFEKSQAALAEARGMFLPSVSIEARYSIANGGRIIDFPIGDLINPVYQSLNDIFTTLGQPQRPFPYLQNEQIQFLREREHETKIRAVQPVFRPALYFNYKLKSKMNVISQNDLLIYQRAVVFDIKQAYFNFLKANELLTLLNSTRQLLEENLRVSTKLFENNMVTKENIYRSETELSQIEQQITEVENRHKLARAYINFLLNKPLDEAIKISNDTLIPLTENDQLESFAEQALKNREELRQIEMAIEVADYSKKIVQSDYLPGVSVVGDFGYQGEEYKFNKDHEYWMVSGVLQWNLFRGFQDKAKAEQSEIQKKKMRIYLEELKKQLRLEVQEVYNDVLSRQKAIETARKRRLSSEASFNIVEKKYENGMASQIEYLEARTSLTDSEVNYIIITYDLLIDQARLEKVTSSYQFEKTEEAN